MKTFLLFIGLPFAAIMTFFSGSLPYTLIHDEAALKTVSFEGDEPLSAEVVRCELPDTARLRLGSPMNTAFRVTLQNNTNRFIVISAIGEVFDPKGRTAGIHSKMFVVNPNTVEETVFRSNTPFSVPGRYRCELRYAIGRFEY